MTQNKQTNGCMILHDDNDQPNIHGTHDEQLKMGQCDNALRRWDNSVATTLVAQIIVLMIHATMVAHELEVHHFTRRMI